VSNDRGDLVEGQGEHVVQYEGQPLGQVRTQGSSRRDLSKRSMSRQTGATIVVSPSAQVLDATVCRIG
jgi:hypothetical protein